MKYQVGDMLKVSSKEGDALCVIIEQVSNTDFKVFWVIETGYIRNSPGYQLWSESILNHEFMRLS